MHSPQPFLTSEQIRSFREQGFLVLPQISPPEEVAMIKQVLYRLFAEKTGWDRGSQFDMVGLDDGGSPALSPQIIDPVAFAPELRDTQFRANALGIARELLGSEVECSYEHAIYKPPRIGSGTPWHQDEAFHTDQTTEYDAISFWMPMQEVTAANGCLQFIPGSHLGKVLTHRSPNNDPRIHALECSDEFDRSAAVSCPLPSGGATIHHRRTLHAAGANASEMERCAYVLTFKTPSRPSSQRRQFSWNTEKQTARLARREGWRHRGGLLGRVGRKLKRLLLPGQP